MKSTYQKDSKNGPSQFNSIKIKVTAFVSPKNDRANSSLTQGKTRLNGENSASKRLSSYDVISRRNPGKMSGG